MTATDRRPDTEPARSGDVQVDPAAHDAVLELQDVHVRFGGIRALSGVDLSVPAGTICGLIGPNGAGKTTLFDVVSGLRTPHAGRVRYEGRDITTWPAVRRARSGVRRTFQRVQPYGWLTVADNVLAALEWRGGGGGLLADVVRLPARRTRESARRALVEEVLEQCGLAAVRDELTGSLPIGLTRMVELARALVDDPHLLLLDEPTSGLDVAEERRLAERIATLRGRDGRSVLLVEHDVGFVMKVCDQVAVLERGRVLAAGTPQEIKANPAVRVAYLGSGSDMPLTGT